MTENMGYRKYRAGRHWLRAGAPLFLVLVGLVAAVAVARADDPLGHDAKGPGERIVPGGVTIAGVPVGGFTARQATSATAAARTNGDIGSPATRLASQSYQTYFALAVSRQASKSRAGRA